MAAIEGDDVRKRSDSDDEKQADPGDEDVHRR